MSVILLPYGKEVDLLIRYMIVYEYLRLWMKNSEEGFFIVYYCSTSFKVSDKIYL